MQKGAIALSIVGLVIGSVVVLLGLLGLTCGSPCASGYIFGQLSGCYCDGRTFYGGIGLVLVLPSLVGLILSFHKRTH